MTCPLDYSGRKPPVCLIAPLQYTAACGHPRLVAALASLYTELLRRPTGIRAQSEVLVANGAYEVCSTMYRVFESLRAKLRDL